MATLLADFDTAHCGVIHDAQLDTFGQCLATASADGHIRLWDVRKPQEPAFLADLGGHAGAVYQVAWAPPAAAGVLLASGGADGAAVVWGRGAAGPSSWLTVRRESLERHGAVRAMAWAPQEHGVVLACASADGTVTLVSYLGTVRSGEATVEHRWHAQGLPERHAGQASAVSWATPPVLSDKPLGLKGARLASAGDDGVRVWRYHEARESWEAEQVEQALPADPEGGSAPGAAASGVGPVAARDVAWKPWDGIREMLASASGSCVYIWTQAAAAAGEGEGARSAAPSAWRATQRVPLGEDVWKVSWADLGGVLLVSFGREVQRTALLKQRLDGEWDVMDVAVKEH